MTGRFSYVSRKILRRLLQSFTDFAQRAFVVIIQVKDLYQARDFKSAAHKRRCGNEADAAVMLSHSPHGINQYAQGSTVQVRNFGEVHNNMIMFVLNKLTQLVAKLPASVQINFPFQVYDGDLIRGFLHINFQYQSCQPSLRPIHMHPLA